MELAVQGDAEALAARVAQSDGAIHVDGGVEHVAQLVLVLRGHELHVGHGAQEADIEDAVLRRAVFTDDAGAVQREDDVQVLHADIVQHLVISTLQEGRVDGGNGLEAADSQPTGEGDGVLLGNAHVKVAVGEAFVQLLETGSLGHRRRDANNGDVPLGQFNQRVGEDISIVRGVARVLLDGAGLEVEGAGAVPLGRIFFGKLPALALLRDHLYNDRPSIFLIFSKTSSIWARSWPSKGPKNLKPSSSKMAPLLLCMTNCLKLVSARPAASRALPPTTGNFSIEPFAISRRRW